MKTPNLLKRDMGAINLELVDGADEVSDMNLQLAHLQLKKMSNRVFFDICGLGDVLDLLGLEYLRKSPEFEDLRRFHCIDYASMSPEMLEHVATTLCKILGVDLVEKVAKAAPKPNIEETRDLMTRLKRSFQLLLTGQPYPVRIRTRFESVGTLS